jgi:hypothetical protein
LCFASTAAVIHLCKALATNRGSTAYLRPEAGFANDSDKKAMGDRVETTNYDGNQLEDGTIVCCMLLSLGSIRWQSATIPMVCRTNAYSNSRSIVTSSDQPLR